MFHLTSIKPFAYLKKENTGMSSIHNERAYKGEMN